MGRASNRKKTMTRHSPAHRLSGDQVAALVAGQPAYNEKEKHDMGAGSYLPPQHARVIPVTWTYSPAHSMQRANANAIAVAGRLNAHIYVAQPCAWGPDETIDLFFAAHPDCMLGDSDVQALIEGVIAPLAEHSRFDVGAPSWQEVPAVPYYDGRTYDVSSAYEGEPGERGVVMLVHGTGTLASLSRCGLRSPYAAWFEEDEQDKQQPGYRD